MSDDEDIAALVVDNGSGMCKGKKSIVFPSCRSSRKMRKLTTTTSTTKSHTDVDVS